MSKELRLTHTHLTILRVIQEIFSSPIPGDRIQSVNIKPCVIDVFGMFAGPPRPGYRITGRQVCGRKFTLLFFEVKLGSWSLRLIWPPEVSRADTYYMIQWESKMPWFRPKVTLLS